MSIFPDLSYRAATLSGAALLVLAQAALPSCNRSSAPAATATASTMAADSTARDSAAIAGELAASAAPVADSVQRGAPDSAAVLPFDPAVQRGTLANGLAYFIRPNARPTDRAELRLMVKAGSILEDDDQRGLAHFVEHMAFNGTENFAENELVDYLQSTGAKFGPDLNAYTSFDETVYMLQVRTDSADMLDKGLQILRDWAGGLTFDSTEIDKERGVVLSEWRSGLGAQERLRNETLPVVFANSRYADRLPIGDTTVLKRAPYDALRRFYREWYRPDLMAVAVIGDVEPAEIEARIQELFDDLENPAEERERTEYDGPSYDKTQVVVASDPEATYTLVQTNYLLTEAKTEDVADYRRRLTAALYNQMLGARFGEKTEDPSTPFSFAGSGRSGLVGNVDAYSSYALAKPGMAREALVALETENRRVLQYGFTEPELVRAKANVLDGSRNAAREKEKTPSSQYASGLVQAFLNDEPLLSADEELELDEGLVPEITLEEVNALAAEFMSDRPRAVVVTGPESEPLPGETGVKQSLMTAKTQRLEPYVDAAPAGDVEIPELTPVPVETTERYDSNGVTLYTLDNGVRIALKPTDFSDNEIVFSGVSRGGSNQFTDDQFPDADMAVGVGTAMGVGPYTPSQLRKALAGKSVSVQAYLSGTEDRMRGSATPETLPDLFELVYLQFQGAAYDSSLAAAFMGQQRSFIENLDANPQFAFAKALTEELYGEDNPRHQLPSAEMLDAVDTEAAYELWRSRFADARDWQFNFVGTFDPDTVLAYARRYLGNLPSGDSTDAIREFDDEMKTGDLERRFQAGKAPKSNIIQLRAGGFPEDDGSRESELERMRFRTMVDVLNEELRERLREDLGGVYGVRVSGGVTELPKPEYSVSISYNAEPERVDELLNATQEVLENIRANGPKEKSITAVRATQFQGMKTAMTNSNGFWLPVLEEAYTMNKDIDQTSLANLRSLQAEVNAKEIQAATKLYFGEAATTKLEVVMDPEVVIEAPEEAKEP